MATNNNYSNYFDAYRESLKKNAKGIATDEQLQNLLNNIGQAEVLLSEVESALGGNFQSTVPVTGINGLRLIENTVIESERILNQAKSKTELLEKEVKQLTQNDTEYVQKTEALKQQQKELETVSRHAGELLSKYYVYVSKSGQFTNITGTGKHYGEYNKKANEVKKHIEAMQKTHNLPLLPSRDLSKKEAKRIERDLFKLKKQSIHTSFNQNVQTMGRNLAAREKASHVTATSFEKEITNVLGGLFSDYIAFDDIITGKPQSLNPQVSSMGGGLLIQSLGSLITYTKKIKEAEQKRGKMQDLSGQEAAILSDAIFQSIFKSKRKKTVFSDDTAKITANTFFKGLPIDDKVLKEIEKIIEETPLAQGDTKGAYVVSGKTFEDKTIEKMIQQAITRKTYKAKKLMEKVYDNDQEGIKYGIAMLQDEIAKYQADLHVSDTDISSYLSYYATHPLNRQTPGIKKTSGKISRTQDFDIVAKRAGALVSEQMGVQTERLEKIRQVRESKLAKGSDPSFIAEIFNKFGKNAKLKVIDIENNFDPKDNSKNIPITFSSSTYNQKTQRFNSDGYYYIKENDIEKSIGNLYQFLTNESIFESRDIVAQELGFVDDQGIALSAAALQGMDANGVQAALRQFFNKSKSAKQFVNPYTQKTISGANKISFISPEEYIKQLAGNVIVSANKSHDVPILTQYAGTSADQIGAHLIDMFDMEIDGVDYSNQVKLSDNARYMPGLTAGVYEAIFAKINQLAHNSKSDTVAETNAFFSMSKNRDLAIQIINDLAEQAMLDYQTEYGESAQDSQGRFKSSVKEWMSGWLLKQGDLIQEKFQPNYQDFLTKSLNLKAHPSSSVDYKSVKKADIEKFQQELSASRQKYFTREGLGKRLETNISGIAPKMGTSFVTTSAQEELSNLFTWAQEKGYQVFWDRKQGQGEEKYDFYVAPNEIYDPNNIDATKSQSMSFSWIAPDEHGRLNENNINSISRMMFDIANPYHPGYSDVSTWGLSQNVHAIISGINKGKSIEDINRQLAGQASTNRELAPILAKGGKDLESLRWDNSWLTPEASTEQEQKRADAQMNWTATLMQELKRESSREALSEITKTPISSFYEVPQEVANLFHRFLMERTYNPQNWEKAIDIGKDEQLKQFLHSEGLSRLREALDFYFNQGGGFYGSSLSSRSTGTGKAYANLQADIPFSDMLVMQALGSENFSKAKENTENKKVASYQELTKSGIWSESSLRSNPNQNTAHLVAKIAQLDEKIIQAILRHATGVQGKYSVDASEELLLGDEQFTKLGSYLGNMRKKAIPYQELHQDLLYRLGTTVEELKNFDVGRFLSIDKEMQHATEGEISASKDLIIPKDSFISGITTTADGIVLNYLTKTELNNATKLADTATGQRHEYVRVTKDSIDKGFEEIIQGEQDPTKKALYERQKSLIGKQGIHLFKMQTPVKRSASFRVGGSMNEGLWEYLVNQVTSESLYNDIVKKVPSFAARYKWDQGKKGVVSNVTLKNGRRVTSTGEDIFSTPSFWESKIDSIQDKSLEVASEAVRAAYMANVEEFINGEQVTYKETESALPQVLGSMYRDVASVLVDKGIIPPEAVGMVGQNAVNATYQAEYQQAAGLGEINAGASRVRNSTRYKEKVWGKLNSMVKSGRLKSDTAKRAYQAFLQEAAGEERDLIDYNAAALAAKNKVFAQVQSGMPSAVFELVAGHGQQLQDNQLDISQMLFDIPKSDDNKMSSDEYQKSFLSQIYNFAKKKNMVLGKDAQFRISFSGLAEQAQQKLKELGFYDQQVLAFGAEQHGDYNGRRQIGGYDRINANFLQNFLKVAQNPDAEVDPYFLKSITKQGELLASKVYQSVMAEKAASGGDLFKRAAGKKALQSMNFKVLPMQDDPQNPSQGVISYQGALKMYGLGQNPQPQDIISAYEDLLATIKNRTQLQGTSLQDEINAGQYTQMQTLSQTEKIQTYNSLLQKYLTVLMDKGIPLLNTFKRDPIINDANVAGGFLISPDDKLGDNVVLLPKMLADALNADYDGDNTSAFKILSGENAAAAEEYIQYTNDILAETLKRMTATSQKKKLTGLEYGTQLINEANTITNPQVGASFSIATKQGQALLGLKSTENTKRRLQNEIYRNYFSDGQNKDNLYIADQLFTAISSDVVEQKGISAKQNMAEAIESGSGTWDYKQLEKISDVIFGYTGTEEQQKTLKKYSIDNDNAKLQTVITMLENIYHKDRLLESGFFDLDKAQNGEYALSFEGMERILTHAMSVRKSVHDNRSFYNKKESEHYADLTPGMATGPAYRITFDKEKGAVDSLDSSLAEHSKAMDQATQAEQAKGLASDELQKKLKGEESGVKASTKAINEHATALAKDVKTFESFRKHANLKGFEPVKVKRKETATGHEYIDEKGNRVRSITEMSGILENPAGKPYFAKQQEAWKIAEAKFASNSGPLLKTDIGVGSDEEFSKFTNSMGAALRGDIVHEIVDVMAKSGKSISELQGGNWKDLVAGNSNINSYKNRLGMIGLGDEYLQLDDRIETYLSVLDKMGVSLTKASEQYIGVKLRGDQGDYTVAGTFDQFLAGVNGLILSDTKTFEPNGKQGFQLILELIAAIANKQNLVNAGLITQDQADTINENTPAVVMSNTEKGTKAIGVQMPSFNDAYAQLAWGFRIINGEAESLGTTNEVDYMGAMTNVKAQAQTAQQIEQYGSYDQRQKNVEESIEKYKQNKKSLLSLRQAVNKTDSEIDDIDSILNQGDISDEQRTELVSWKQGLIDSRESQKNVIDYLESMVVNSDNTPYVNFAQKTFRGIQLNDQQWADLSEFEGKMLSQETEELLKGTSSDSVDKNVKRYIQLDREQKNLEREISSGSVRKSIAATDDDKKYWDNYIETLRIRKKQIDEIKKGMGYSKEDGTLHGKKLSAEQRSYLDSELELTAGKNKTFNATKTLGDQYISSIKHKAATELDLEKAQAKQGSLSGEAAQRMEAFCNSLQNFINLITNNQPVLDEENHTINGVALSEQEYNDIMLRKQSVESEYEIKTNKFRTENAKKQADEKDKKVTSATKKYISDLKEQYALEEKILSAEQQMATNKKGDQLTNQGFINGLRTNLSRVRSNMGDLDLVSGTINGLEMSPEQLSSLRSQLDKMEGTHYTKMQGIQAKIPVQQGFFEKMFGSFKAQISGFINTSLAYQAIGMVRSTIHSLIATTEQLDQALVNIQIATGKTRDETKDLMRSYVEIGDAMGRTTSSIATAANDWLRAGYDGEKAAKLTQSSMMLSTLGMIEANQATTYLISTLKGWQLSAAEVSSVVDKLTAVDMAAAISAGDLALAMSRANNSARIAGSSMDNFIGYITTVADVTQKSPESIGESFKTIYSRFGNVKAGKFVASQEEMESNGYNSDEFEKLNDIETVLSTVDVNLRDNATSWRDVDAVLMDIGKNWNHWDKTTQNAVATAVAGTRQRENVVSLFENWDSVQMYSEIAKNSYGTAVKKMESYSDSVEAAKNRFMNAVEAWSLYLDKAQWIKSFYNALTFLSENITTIAVSLAGLGIVTHFDKASSFLLGTLNKLGLKFMAFSNFMTEGNILSPKGRDLGTAQRTNRLQQQFILSQQKHYGGILNALSSVISPETLQTGKIIQASALTMSAKGRRSFSSMFSDQVKGLSFSASDAQILVNTLSASGKALDQGAQDLIKTLNSGIINKATINLNPAQLKTISGSLRGQIGDEQLLYRILRNMEDSSEMSAGKQVAAGVLGMIGGAAGAYGGSYLGESIGKKVTGEEEAPIGQVIGTTIGGAAASISAEVLLKHLIAKGGIKGAITAAGGTLAKFLGGIAGPLGVLGVTAVSAGVKYVKDKKEKEEKERLAKMQEKIKDYDEKKSGMVLAKKIDSLSHGVGSLGQNVSLTAEEYRNFINYNNQLIDLFPELQFYTDEQGNRFLDMATGAGLVSEKIKDLIDKAQQLADKDFISPEVNGKMFNDIQEKFKNLEDEYSFNEINSETKKEVLNEFSNSEIKRVQHTVNGILDTIFNDLAKQEVSLTEKGKEVLVEGIRNYIQGGNYGEFLDVKDEILHNLGTYTIKNPIAFQKGFFEKQNTQNELRPFSEAAIRQNYAGFNDLSHEQQQLAYTFGSFVSPFDDEGNELGLEEYSQKVIEFVNEAMEKYSTDEGFINYLTDIDKAKTIDEVQKARAAFKESLTSLFEGTELSDQDKMLLIHFAFEFDENGIIIDKQDLKQQLKDKLQGDGDKDALLNEWGIGDMSRSDFNIVYDLAGQKKINTDTSVEVLNALMYHEKIKTEGTPQKKRDYVNFLMSGEENLENVGSYMDWASKSYAITEDNVASEVSNKFANFAPNVQNAISDGIMAIKDGESDIGKEFENVTKIFGQSITNSFNEFLKCLNKISFSGVELGDDGIIGEWSELNQALDSVTKSYEMLENAQKEQAAIGHLTWTSITSLLSQNPEYIDMLDLTGKKIKLKNNAEEIMMKNQIKLLKQNIQAKINMLKADKRELEAQIKMAENKEDVIIVQNNSIRANTALINSLNELSAAYLNTANSVKTLSTEQNITSLYNRAEELRKQGDDVSAAYLEQEAERQYVKLTHDKYVSNPVETEITPETIKWEDYDLESAKETLKQMDSEIATLEKFYLDLTTLEEKGFSKGFYDKTFGPYDPSKKTKESLERLKDLIGSLNKEFYQMIGYRDKGLRGLEEVSAHMRKNFFDVKRMLLDRAIVHAKSKLNGKGINEIMAMDDENFDKYLSYYKDLQDLMVERGNLRAEEIEDKIKIAQLEGANLMEVSDLTGKISGQIAGQIDLENQIVNRIVQQGAEAETSLDIQKKLQRELIQNANTYDKALEYQKQYNDLLKQEQDLRHSIISAINEEFQAMKAFKTGIDTQYFDLLADALKKEEQAIKDRIVNNKIALGEIVPSYVESGPNAQAGLGVGSYVQVPAGMIYEIMGIGENYFGSKEAGEALGYRYNPVNQYWSKLTDYIPDGTPLSASDSIQLEVDRENNLMEQENLDDRRVRNEIELQEAKRGDLGKLTQLYRELLKTADTEKEYYDYYQEFLEAFMKDFEKQIEDQQRQINLIKDTRPDEWASTFNKHEQVDKSAVDKIKDYYKELDKMYKNQLEIAKEFLEHADELTEEEINKIVDEANEAIKNITANAIAQAEDIKAHQESIYSALVNEVQRYIDQLQKEKEIVADNYDDEIKKLQDKEDSIERTNKLIELQNALLNAQKGKQRVYREGIGWVYEANREKIRKAEADLKEFQRKDTIEDLKNAKDAELQILDDSIKNWEDYLKMLEEKYKEYEILEEKRLLKELLGVKTDEEIQERIKDDMLKFTEYVAENQSLFLKSQSEGYLAYNSTFNNFLDEYKTNLEKLAELKRQEHELLNSNDYQGNNFDEIQKPDQGFDKNDGFGDSGNGGGSGQGGNKNPNDQQKWEWLNKEYNEKGYIIKTGPDEYMVQNSKGETMGYIVTGIPYPNGGAYSESFVNGAYDFLYNKGADFGGYVPNNGGGNGEVVLGGGNNGNKGNGNVENYMPDRGKPNNSHTPSNGYPIGGGIGGGSNFTDNRLYANGIENGPVTFTGLAMLHGTPGKPEYVLNNDQAYNMLRYFSTTRPSAGESLLNNDSGVSYIVQGDVVLEGVDNPEEFWGEVTKAMSNRWNVTKNR